MMTNTLQENDFVEQARCLVEGHWDLAKARSLLKHVPTAAWGLEERGMLIERMLKSTWQESAQEDAAYLTEYWKSILLVDFRALMYDPSSEDDNNFFANEAFVSMLEYQEASHQGLEFVRVFLRISMQYEAMKAHDTFVGDNNWEHVTHSKPMYDALHAVLNNLETFSEPTFRAHPVWSTMLQTPEHVILVERMLCYLNEGLEQQKEYRRSKKSKEPTSFELLHGIAETLISRGSLQPSGLDATERYWQWRDLATKDGCLFQQVREFRFTQEMLRHGGEGLHLGLQYLFESPSPCLALIQAFFPLPLHRCNARKVLYWLDLLVDDRPDNNARESANVRKYQQAQIMMMFLEQHHNGIAQLLSTHASLRENTVRHEYSSDAMLQAFEHILSGASDTELDISDISELV